VKFNHLGDPRFDYRRIEWEDAPHGAAAAAHAANGAVHNGNGSGAPAQAAGPRRRLERLRPAFLTRSSSS